MDFANIPTCALFRHGTVIVRMKMDTAGCCQPEPCPGSDSPRAVHRPSDCELCTRTRYSSRRSECDSGTVTRWRPYRPSEAKSRYVTAVCLLLLVSLSPQSTAAPYRSRIMDRQKRATEENSLWGNPCGFNNVDSQSEISYSTKFAKKAAAQAKSAYNRADSNKDLFASELQNYQHFKTLMDEWSTYEWLRSAAWFRDEVLPKEKKYDQRVSDTYLNELMPKIDEVLPLMYKTLKLVVAGLDVYTKEGMNDNIVAESTYKKNLLQTMQDARAVLCEFSDIMRSRKLEIIVLTDSEVQDSKTRVQDILSFGILVYRDTLNYLGYLEQVFQKMSEST